MMAKIVGNNATYPKFLLPWILCCRIHPVDKVRKIMVKYRQMKNNCKTKV